MKKFLLQRVFLFVFLLLILVSCSSERSQMYEMAYKKVKTMLRSPSTAEFQNVRKIKFKIIDSLDYDIPMLWEDSEKYYYLTGLPDKSKEYKDNLSRHRYNKTAELTFYCDAQNGFGAMIRNTWTARFRCWPNDKNYSKWKLCSVRRN